MLYEFESRQRLTAWEHHPNEVHEKVVTPEVEKLGARINNVLVVEVKGMGCIVQNEAIYLTNTDNDLERVAKWMCGGNHACHDEAERSPSELRLVLASWWARWGER